MNKVYLAEKAQLDEQNQVLMQINAKIAPKNLTNVNVALLDFIRDTVVITSGGLDSVNRRITT